MECPKCGSAEVKQLPPDQISKHPGDRCGNCGLKMRSAGMLLPYMFTLLIGLAFFAGTGYMLIDEDAGGRVLKAAFLGVVGIVVAGYSVIQIARPVPKRGSSASGPK